MYYTSHSPQSAYIVQQLLIDSLNELVVVFDQSNRRPSNQSQLELVDSGSGREIVRINVRRGAEEIGGQLRSDERAASFGLPVPNKRLSVIHSTHSDDHSIAKQIVIRTELRIRVRVEQRGPIMRREHAEQNVQHLPIPRRRDFFALIRHNQQAFELLRHTHTEKGVRQGTALGGGRWKPDRKCLRETGRRSTQNEDEPPTDPAAWRGIACEEWSAEPVCMH